MMNVNCSFARFNSISSLRNFRHVGDICELNNAKQQFFVLPFLVSQLAWDEKSVVLLILLHFAIEKDAGINCIREHAVVMFVRKERQYMLRGVK
jgi:hypothetical protein